MPFFLGFPFVVMTSLIVLAMKFYMLKSGRGNMWREMMPLLTLTLMQFCIVPRSDLLQ